MRFVAAELGVMSVKDMNIESIKNCIQNIDWEKYDGPEYYESHEVAPALFSLLLLEKSVHANDVGDKILDALGNNHAGTYYPAILSALDIIISIEKEAPDSARKICAKAILNDLSCFEPEPDLRNYKSHSLADILKIAQSKLEPYSDWT